MNIRTEVKLIGLALVIPLACFAAAAIPTAKPPRIIWYEVADTSAISDYGYCHSIILRGWSNGKIESRGISWYARDPGCTDTYMCAEGWVNHEHE
tara:strand:+ start:50 stop:334 length:285 start_codon:yes stop_codon:yes gene_type:complete